VHWSHHGAPRRSRFVQLRERIDRQRMREMRREMRQLRTELRLPGARFEFRDGGRVAFARVAYRACGAGSESGPAVARSALRPGAPRHQTPYRIASRGYIRIGPVAPASTTRTIQFARHDKGGGHASVSAHGCRSSVYFVDLGFRELRYAPPDNGGRTLMGSLQADAKNPVLASSSSAAKHARPPSKARKAPPVDRALRRNERGGPGVAIIA